MTVMPLSKSLSERIPTPIMNGVEPLPGQRRARLRVLGAKVTAFVQRPHVCQLICCSLLLQFIFLLAQQGAVAAEQVELTGRVEIRVINCFSTEPHDHDHDTEYFVVDVKTGVKTKLAGDKALLSKLAPRQSIRVTGSRSVRKVGGVAPPLPKGLGLTPESELTAGALEILSDPDAEALTAPNPEVAPAAPTLKMLSCLLVFAAALDNPCAVSETNATGRLFNNATNANLGMQSLTKGHYGLQLGNGSSKPAIVTMTLNTTSAGKTAQAMESLMLTELANLGYDRYAYDRVLLFPPAGVNGFTAYAYLESISSDYTGRVSVYGANYGNNYMSGYLHELGHNFGFHHSSK